MISIVICSISPERLRQVIQNIQGTIGVEYEIIAIDNREKNWPIARVYNEGAYRAQYPYLFFVHEDVKFHSRNWGLVIEEKIRVLRSIRPLIIYPSYWPILFSIINSNNFIFYSDSTLNILNHLP